MPVDDPSRFESRRAVLRDIGALWGTAALAGCGGGSTPGTPPPDAVPRPVRSYAESFETVVDLSAVGADTAGNRAINDLLTEYVGDDTLLYLPPGRYLMDGIFRLNEFRNVGLVGHDAVIAPPDGYADYLFAFGTDGGATDLLIEGLTFDFRAPDTGARPIQALVADNLLVRDVSVRGVQDTTQDLLRFDVTSSDGSGTVRNLRLPDGGATGTATTGCYVGESNRGTLSFVDCHIANFPDNGLYASSATGSVRVLGGRYENNGISNVRVSGKSLVSGVHVRCDAPREGFKNMRGIRVQNGSETRIEHCRVDLIDVTGSDGAITLSSQADGAVITNTRLHVDVDDTPAIVLKPPTTLPSPPSRIFCQDVVITGAASGAATIEIIDRNNCRFSRLCLRQTGADRDGIRFVRSNDNTVRDSTIDVTGAPLVLDGSTVERRNVTLAGAGESASCLNTPTTGE